jgi:hypothetical protein
MTDPGGDLESLAELFDALADAEEADAKGHGRTRPLARRDAYTVAAALARAAADCRRRGKGVVIEVVERPAVPARA